MLDSDKQAPHSKLGYIVDRCCAASGLLQEMSGKVQQMIKYKKEKSGIGGALDATDSSKSKQSVQAASMQSTQYLPAQQMALAHDGIENLAVIKNEMEVALAKVKTLHQEAQRLFKEDEKQKMVAQDCGGK
jgi:hypothetical protein